ncbi:MAG TPA: c-type cytochrome [Woeseiaceae bacterium]|nr:c-type cytochrome [Woeseiaceae bacterium]
MNRDQKFFDLYSLVIGGLAAIGLALFILAMEMAEVTQGVYTQETDEFQAAINERIQPLSQVYLPGEADAAARPAASAPAAPEPVATTMTGPQVYNSACIACHGTGVGGAPKVGDPAVWAERMAKGMETLSQHAIEGFIGSAGVMPAKGGRTDLSDEEVVDAVRYMVDEST